MEFISIPVIVMLCYLVGEILKVVFKKHKNLNNLIPCLVSLFGGVIGILVYLTSKEMLAVNNIWNALMAGLISGAASTGTNQIIKKTVQLKGES